MSAIMPQAGTREVPFYQRVPRNQALALVGAIDDLTALVYQALDAGLGPKEQRPLSLRIPDGLYTAIDTAGPQTDGELLVMFRPSFCSQGHDCCIWNCFLYCPWGSIKLAQGSCGHREIASFASRVVSAASKTLIPEHIANGTPLTVTVAISNLNSPRALPAKPANGSLVQEALQSWHELWTARRSAQPQSSKVP